jgi:hypothetical protein
MSLDMSHRENRSGTSGGVNDLYRIYHRSSEGFLHETPDPRFQKGYRDLCMSNRGNSHHRTLWWISQE